MTHEVKVSVIIPVYNVEDYIAETLDSLLNQTLKAIEIITVNDGSSDGSQKIINDFKEKHSCIVSIEKENEGPGIARNVGLQRARGEFIKFMDSDDLLPVDALETEYLTAKEMGADLIIGATHLFDSKGTYPLESHYRQGVYNAGYKSLLENPEILFSVGPCNKLYKKSILHDCKFPKGIKVTEDHPFVINAYLNAQCIYTTDKVIYLYRRREDEGNASLSQMVSSKSLNVLKDICKSVQISTELMTEKVENQLERQFIITKYYARLVIADIWPALKRTIDTGTEEEQIKAFGILEEFITDIDDVIFDKLLTLQFIMTKWTVDRYLRLKGNAKNAHLRLVMLYGQKASGQSKSRLREHYGDFYNYITKVYEKESTRYIYYFLVKRRLKRVKQKVKNTYHYRRDLTVKKVAFKIGSWLPIKKNRVVLASNKANFLSGNLKSIHDEIYRNRRDLHVTVYLPKETAKFTKVSKIWNFYYTCGQAKYIILDDYYRQLYGLKFRKGAEVIQTWHACGAFKKFGFSAVGMKESNPRAFEHRAHDHYTKVTVSSEEIVKHYAEAFNVDAANVLPLGVPRTDMFFDKEYKEYIQNYFFRKYPMLKGKKIITYAPTFRGSPAERRSFKLKLDLDKMVKGLSEDYVIVLKMHPSVSNQLVVDPSYADRVLDLSKHGDVNDVLLITDYLISDYSSLVFEYSLLNRPMIFFAYDLEEYMHERNFYYKYEEFVPGPIVKTTEEVIESILENDFDYGKIQTFSAKFVEICDGNVTKRLVNELLKR